MASADIGFSTRPAASVQSESRLGGSRATRLTSRPEVPWLKIYLTAIALGAAIVSGTAAAGVGTLSPPTVIALLLIAVTALWISGGAATALIGLFQPAPPCPAIGPSWHAALDTAILVLLCGEPAEPLAAYLRSLHGQLRNSSLGDRYTVFVLSDTRGEPAISAEASALAPLIDDGAIRYRRRTENLGRKPGNIADWLQTHGDDFDLMVVLDTDSRLSADRIRSLVHRMEHEPGLGLLQAGLSMVPGRSRFGRHQRLSNRLLSGNFGRGFAAWSGPAGNYWGHNAIMRVAAFRKAASLPVLSGAAPFGGPPLSHDFIEAAWIRRAGWIVALDPDTRGSAEDGPQTLTEFHRRDRRWCQGNLQHLRLIAEPGLDPVSRLHLASGIASYLVAPIWLALVLLIGTGLVTIHGALPLFLIGLILMLPKLCALAHWVRRARTARRRRLIYRASLSELFVSTVVAPLIMLRQSGAVLSVVLGRDCGWKPSGTLRFETPSGVVESGIGMAFLALGSVSAAGTVWLLPLAIPLILAPLLQRWLDEGA